MEPALRTALTGAEELLFVCSGNMLRSAFAELLARHRGLARPCSSVGTTYRNPAIHPEAARALAARGVDPAAIRTFRPTHLADRTPAPGPGTLVLAMTRDHLAEVPALAPDAGPAFLLEAARVEDRELADPLFTGAYGPTFARVEACVDALVAALAD